MSASDSDNVILIKPSRWISFGFGDLWKYRELLYFLTWRDIKVRYKQTAIGIAWAVLQPVITTAIFTVIFSTLAKFDTQNVPYPLFALSGLMVWLFVHASVTSASASFVSNTNLVTKVYFPRIILPTAATLSGLIDLLISFVVLLVVMSYYGIHLTLQIIAIPLFLILALLLTVAFGTLFSAINVRFRDVKHALPFLLQVWMIASPIFYPVTLLSEKWRPAFAVNPLVGLLSGLRSSLFGTPFEWEIIGVSFASIIVIMLVSLFVFKWMEDDFADIV